MNGFNNHAPIELINIVPFNPLISKCQIKVCWVGYQPNRNKSIITKDVAREMANSLPGSPIEDILINLLVILKNIIS